VGAAIANAIYHATGVRVRDYPITPDKLIDGLPEMVCFTATTGGKCD
jgi:xanthine dehydrogenase YagR molybdenum-binding subunit